MFKLEILIALLFMLLGALGVNAPDSPIAPQAAIPDKPANPSQGDDVPATEKVLTNIFQVDVQVMESFPMRIALDVAGEHPDGCDLPVHVAQSRDGNSVQVEVYRELPPDMVCPMILRPYADNIMLDGDFVSGSYSITVNAHTQTIDI